MASPTKRVLKEDDVAEFGANVARPDLVSADIMLALQNVGRRVRQNVMHGYATDRADVSVPPTPHSSPAKAPSTAALSPAIFRSDNDSLRSAFDSIPVISPSSSPRKRVREDASDSTGAIILGDEANLDANSSDVVKPVRRTRPIPRHATRAEPVLMPAAADAFSPEDNLPPSYSPVTPLDQDMEWFSTPPL